MDFTHFNDSGLSRMVDVSDKDSTHREATATAFVILNDETINRIKAGMISKGDVLAVAQVAGIMAVKKTSDTIPMCHLLPITGADISFEFEENGIRINSNVKCDGKTGVEMEALHAVSVAALTIYDMCKAVQKDIVISDIHLLTKTGGKSGDFVFER